MAVVERWPLGRGGMGVNLRLYFSGVEIFMFLNNDYCIIQIYEIIKMYQL